MRNTAKAMSIAKTNLTGLINADHPAGNLSGVVAKLQASSEDSYKALFDELQKQGNVKHDSSIIGPAAYFADLMRMVVAKEGKNPNLPKARKLLSRRPDMFKIPMDAKHTSMEKPYLELVNNALCCHSGAREYSKTGKQRYLAGFHYQKPSFDIPLHRMCAFFEASGTPVGEVLRTLNNSDLADAASFGMDDQSFSRLCDQRKFHIKHDDLNTAYFMLGALDTVDRSQTQTGIPGNKAFMLRFGIDADFIDALTGESAFGGYLSSVITGAIFDREIIPITEIRVPNLNEGANEARLTWLKKPGEGVAAGEVIAEVETDKVAMEISSPVKGEMSEHLEADGGTVGPDQLLTNIKEFRRDTDNRDGAIYGYLETDEGLQLAYRMDIKVRLEGMQPTPSIEKLNYSEESDRRNLAAIVELRRISQIATLLGWSGSELLYVAEMLTSGPHAVYHFNRQDMLLLAKIRKFQTEHDLSLEDAVLLCGFTENTLQDTVEGKPAYGKSLLPDGADDERLAIYPLAALPAWLAAGEGISVTHLHRMFAVAERERIEAISHAKAKNSAIAGFPNATVGIDQKTALRPHQYVTLAKVLDADIDDILLVQESLGLPFSNAEHVTDLVEKFAFLKEAKLEPKQAMVMCQISETATCHPADLKLASEVILNGATLGEEPLDEQDAISFWNDAYEQAEQVLADFYGIKKLDLTNLIYASMDHQKRYEFYRAALLGEFRKYENATAIPSTPETVSFSNLQAGILTFKSLNLTGDDILNRDSYEFGIKGNEINQWRSFENLKQWHKVKRFEKATGTTLADITYLQSELLHGYPKKTESDPVVDIVNNLVQLTGVEPEIIDTIWYDKEEIPFADSEGEFCLLDQMEGLRLQGELAKNTGVDLPRLRNICTMFDKSLPFEMSSAATQNWDKRVALSGSVCEAIIGSLPPHERESSIENISKKCLEAERDAWCADVINTLAGFSPDAQMGYPVESKEDLSAMLLIDVEMGGTAKISPIKLGLNTLQNYIHRAQTNQETGPIPFSLDETQWTWRAHYRLWEANRKVFLYPENFLDPGLRRHKTPIFEELEEELLQGEVTQDGVTKAILGYLDKLADLSDLEMVSACAATVLYPGSEIGRKTVYILSRKVGEAPHYFLRACYFDEDGINAVGWTPWEEVRLPIHSNMVWVAFVNNRPHLFWIESKFTGGRISDAETRTYYGTIKFSNQLLAGGWSTPRAMPNWESFKQGRLRQNPDGSWSASDKLSDQEIVFPADVPQVKFYMKTIEGSHEVGGKQPELGSYAFETNELFNGTSLGAPTKDLPAKTDWTQSYYGKAGWKVCDTIRPLIGNDTEDSSSGILYCHALVSDIAGNSLVGLFSHQDQTTMRILRSRDYGRTWQPSEEGIKEHKAYEAGYTNDYLHQIKVAAHSGQMFAVGGLQPIVFYRSDDNGQSWVPMSVPDGVTQYKDLVVSDDGQTLLFSGYQGNNKLYGRSVSNFGFISNDSGQSWEPLNSLHTALPGREVEVFKFAIDGDTGNFFAVLSSDQTLLSKDMGKSWEIAGFKFAPIGSADASRNTTGKYAHLVQNGSGITYLSHGTQVYESPDGGLSFYAEIPKTKDPIVGLLWSGVELVIATKTDLWSWDGESEELDKFGDIPADLFDTDMSVIATGIVRVRSEKQFVMGLNGKGLAYSLPNRHHILDKLENGFESISPDANYLPNAKLTRASTAAPKHLADKLVAEGLQAMLSLETQESNIESNSGGALAEPISFNLSSAYGIYYRELFFHVPYLIADTLNRNKQFAEAQKWYHHTFKPNLIGRLDISGDDTPFWRYKKFRNYELHDLTDCSPEEYALYEEDPFDAHAIAALRIGAYEKAVVMRYIDNLLDWADSLFAQDNWEAITEAMSYYRQAYDLLGPDPAKLRHDDKRVGGKTYSEFEKLVPATVDPADTFHFDDKAVFPIPANAYFEGYWERTRLRMAEIRASENIQGVKRQMALFQPAIDPRKIMAALAAGMSLAQAIGSLNQARPRFRFNTLLRSAQDIAGTVSGFGGTLLSALEKKDAAGLEHLRATHGHHILEMTSQMKEAAVTDAESRLEEVKARQAAAISQKKHFKTLIKTNLLGAEEKSISLQNDALALQATTAGIRTASAVGYLAPAIYGMSNGGMNYGRAVEVTAAALDATAQALNTSSAMSGVQGQNDRRRDEWVWQLELAKTEIKRLKLDQKLAESAVERANSELSTHRTQIEQDDAVMAYARDRFTNEQLYGWMVGRLTGLYKSAFNLALSVSKEAELAYRFERNTKLGEPPIVGQSPITSLQGALLSGEKLQLDLHRLNKVYRDAANVEQEVTRILSLKTLAGNKEICEKGWESIKEPGKEVGELTFNIPHSFLIQDQLGEQVYRKIKSVSITLPAIVAPYQDINGILIQTSYQDPNNDTMPLYGGQPEKIAISHGVNDHGVTSLDFSSPNYQPFEGTGARSSWTLQLPAKGPNSILESLSDVVFEICYVAQSA